MNNNVRYLPYLTFVENRKLNMSRFCDFHHVVIITISNERYYFMIVALHDKLSFSTPVLTGLGIRP